MLQGMQLQLVTGNCWPPIVSSLTTMHRCRTWRTSGLEEVVSTLAYPNEQYLSAFHPVVIVIESHLSMLNAIE